MIRTLTTLLFTLFTISLYSQFDCAAAVTLTCGTSIQDDNINNCQNTILGGYCGNSDYNYTGREKLYKFEVFDNPSTVRILLSGLTADLDMFLLRSCNPQDCISRSTGAGTQSYELISTSLDPGVYYIVVDGWGGAGSAYNLEISCETSLGEIDCANAIALDCGESLWGTTSTSVNNNDGPYCDAHSNYGGPEQVFTFTLDKKSEVTIDVNGLTGDLDMFLLNSCDSKSCVALSGKGGTNSEAIEKELSPGTYYIVLDGYQDAISDYDITLNCIPIEEIDCTTAITTYYSGNGSDLKFAHIFNGGTNTQFLRWKLNGSTISTHAAVNFIFNSPGTYNICAEYKNLSTGEIETCCKSSCVSLPSNCEDLIDYKYVDGHFELSIKGGSENATDIFWRNDTDGIEIDPNDIPASCRTLLVSVRYYDTVSDCWVLCCRKIEFCPPSSCQDNISSSFDTNLSKYTFNFDNPNASHLLWKIDETDVVLENGMFTLPANWECTDLTITVYYYDMISKCWKVCCKRLSICPPVNCEDAIRFDYNSQDNKFIFSLENPTATNEHWVFADGTSIPNGEFAIPEGWVCQDKTVTVFYFDPSSQCWRVCSKVVSICPPSDCESAIDYVFDEDSETYTFSLDIPGASETYWRFDEDDLHLPGGQFTVPNGWTCTDKTVTVFYFDPSSQCWRVCCKVISICPPSVVPIVPIPSTSETVNCISEITIPSPPAIVDGCQELIVPTGPVVTANPTCEGVIIYTWTYTDCIGTIQNYVHNVTIDIPLFPTIPNTTETVECENDIIVITPPTTSDACGNNMIPTGPVVSDSPACEGVINYVWTYTDCAGNARTYKHAVTIDIPAFAPIASTSETVDCENDITVITPPTIRDHCGNNITPTGPVVSDSPACEGVINYVWTYTDCAGNARTYKHAVTIDIPAFAPIASTSETVDCEDDILVTTPPTISDACGNNITPTGPVVSDSPACEGVINYVWTYTDCAGNARTYKHAVTIDIPAFAPIASTSETVDCENDITVITPPTISDHCGNNITPTGPVVSDSPACEGVINYVWTYTDCAGNARTYKHAVTIDIPAFAPIASTSETVDCENDITVITPPTISDHCGNNITPTGPVVSDSPACEGVINYVWTYTDCTGHTRTYKHAVSIDIPAFTPVASTSETVDCENDITVITPPTISDHCGNNMIPTGPVVSDSPACEGVIDYVWTYTDCAGNTRNYKHAVTIDIPLLDPISSTSETVYCKQDISVVAPPSITDACGDSITPVGPEILSTAVCEGDIIYQWTYTDCAGNTQSYQHTVTIDMNLFPAIEPTSEIVGCEADIIEITPPNVRDACQNLIIPKGPFIENSESCEGQTVYTWTYTDCGGNVRNYTHTYTVSTCEEAIRYNFDQSNNGLQFVLDNPNASNISWKFEEGNVAIDEGLFIFPADWDCQVRTVTAHYYDTLSECWKVCCKKIDICPPANCEFNVAYTYYDDENKFVFTLGIENASNVQWFFDEDNQFLPNGEFVIPDSWKCSDKFVTAFYLDTNTNTYKSCCRRINICPPTDCQDAIDFVYNSDGTGINFTFANDDDITDFSWEIQETGQDLGSNPSSSDLLLIPDPCAEYTVSVRYLRNGVWEYCHKLIYICNPDECSDLITYSINNNILTLSVEDTYTEVTWFEADGQFMGSGNTLNYNVPDGPGTFPVIVIFRDEATDCYRSCNADVDLTCGLATPDFEISLAGAGINFMNTTENATSYTWDFGGGIPVQGNENSENPVAVYLNGTYTVCLTASNSCGSESTCKDVVMANNNTCHFDIADDICGVGGEVVYVPVTVSNFTDIVSFNFTIRAANSVNLNIQGIEDLDPMLMSGSNQHIEKDHLRFFWADTDGQDLENNTVIFTIKVLLLESTDEPIVLAFSNDPVKAEAFNGDLEPVDLTLLTGSVCVELPATTADIGGMIMIPESLDPISNTTVTAQGTGNPNEVTHTDGEFYLSDLNLGEAYTLKPSKNTDHSNGINALDIVILQRHILQITMLDSPYKIIAADVNNDKVINGLDVVNMQRLQLGLITEFPNNSSWKFIPANYTFTTSNPLSENYPESITYDPLTVDHMSENFYGIKIGDLNYSANTLNSATKDVATRNTVDTLVLHMDHMYATNQELVRVPITTFNFEKMAAFEGSITWNENELEFLRVEDFGIPTLNESNFGRPIGSDNILTFNWINGALSGTTVDDNTTLFYLVFEPKTDAGDLTIVKWSDDPLNLFAVNSDLASVAVKTENGRVATIAPLTINMDVSNNNCFDQTNGQISLDVSGAIGNYEYLWSTGETSSAIANLSNGNYLCTVTDLVSGFTHTISEDVTSPSELIANIETDSSSYATAIAEGGVAPYTYIWNSGSTESTVSDLLSGTHTVSITDGNNCTTTSSVEVNAINTGNDETVIMPFSVYPNPASDHIIVKLADNLMNTEVEWALVNSIGQTAKKGVFDNTNNLQKIDRGNLLAGVYYLKLINTRSLIPVTVVFAE